MDLLSEYALCLGVCKDKSQLKLNVHLLQLGDLQCVLTRHSQLGEQFEAGKWYRKRHNQRLYNRVDNIIPTDILRSVSGLCTLEVFCYKLKNNKITACIAGLFRT